MPTGVCMNWAMDRECKRLTNDVGWGKFMEWKYPVSVEVTSRGAFKGAGMIEAAASL